MSSYDITVLYARHDAQSAPKVFPHQTLSSKRFQVISVPETDPYHPRAASLAALPEAQGRYTIFLDEEDRFEKIFLEKLLHAAMASPAAFVMPATTCLFLKRKEEHYFLNPPEELLVDVRTSQRIFPTELQGLLLPTEALRAAALKAKGSAEAEKEIILSLLADQPVFHYMDAAVLRYGCPRECIPEYDIRSHGREWYYAPLEQFLLPRFRAKAAQGQPISPIEQFMALFMLNNRIACNSNNRNKHVIPVEDVPAYCDLMSDVMEFIDTDTVLRSKTESQPLFTSDPRILFFLRLKKRDFSYYPDLECQADSLTLLCDGLVFGGMNSLPMRLQQLDFVNGRLEIDGGYYDFLPDGDAKVCAKFDGKNYPLTYNQRYSMTKYFGVTAFRMKTFHVSIPVPPCRHGRLLNFVVCAGGREYVMDYNFPSQGSRFAKDFEYAYWRFGDFLSYWQKDGIHVVPTSKFSVLKKEVALWRQMWKKKDGFYRDQLPVKIINFLLRPYFRRQKIWLFMDKIYKGADSSEYIYRYAARQKDGIKKYYLLDKTSADYARMTKEGYRPLIRGSLKHRLVFLNADMVIASNSTVFAFNDYPFDRSLPIRGDVHFDVACVQHGMSVQKIAIAQQRLRDNTRLYFCASKYEIENLSKPVYDYIGYDALKLTGVPRYDGLVNRAQKIIVISPTWRMQSALPVTISEGFARDYNPNFKESEYYRVYNGLINDPRLLEAARKYGYRIQYVLHPIVSPQHDDFDKNDVVEIIPSIGDMSYEKIFCEGALMVTDFSGVQFDFAYMRKPVIYLHHEDIPQHYEEGTFHYTTMGFGEICHTNGELIDVLCRYMENGCVMPEMYRKRADDFFAFSDNHNCERIYPIMLEHERNRNR